MATSGSTVKWTSSSFNPLAYPLLHRVPTQADLWTARRRVPTDVRSAIHVAPARRASGAQARPQPLIKFRMQRLRVEGESEIQFHETRVPEPLGGGRSLSTGGGATQLGSPISPVSGVRVPLCGDNPSSEHTPSRPLLEASSSRSTTFSQV